MHLLDTNIWLALAISGHTSHSKASMWFASQSQRKSVLFCRSTQQSVLRLLTTDQLMRAYNSPPLTNSAAWHFLDQFLADPRITLAPEPPNLSPIWKKLAARPLSSPKLWMDAYLAAFALAGNLTLVTTDKAFTQFPNLNSLILTP